MIMTIMVMMMRTSKMEGPIDDGDVEDNDDSGDNENDDDDDDKLIMIIIIVAVMNITFMN